MKYKDEKESKAEASRETPESEMSEGLSVGPKSTHMTAVFKKKAKEAAKAHFKENPAYKHLKAKPKAPSKGQAYVSGMGEMQMMGKA